MRLPPLVLVLVGAVVVIAAAPSGAVAPPPGPAAPPAGTATIATTTPPPAHAAATAATNHRTAPSRLAVRRTGTATIQLLGVNDLHGNLEPPVRTSGRRTGGVAYLAAYLKAARARNPQGTLLLHSGDMVGGSPLISSWFHDEPAIEATNRMGFDAGTIGNHELDEGEGEMLRLIRGGQRADGRQAKLGTDTSSARFGGADYPYLSANVVSRRTGRPIFPPSQVFVRKGVQIGVIGVTTLQTEEILPASTLRGLRLLDLSTAVNRQVAVLRRQGVRTIVVLAHAGGDELLRETAQMSPEVDVVLGGHTHEQMNTRVGRRIVIQGGRYGEGFDRVQLRVRRRDDRVLSARATVVETINHGVRPDPSLARLVRGLSRRVAPMGNRVVATTAAPATRKVTAAGENAMGDLIADGQRRLAHADLALVNSGAIRADLPAGPVTFAQAFAAQPWDHEVVAITLRGADVRAALTQQFTPPGSEVLQVSGLTWRRAGAQVTDVMVGDAPLQDDREYRVATYGPLADGADGFTALTRGRDRVTVGSDVDALIGELAAREQPATVPDPRAAPRIAGSA